MTTSIPPAPQEILDRILAAAVPYEFQTFVVGFSRPEDYLREDHEARFRALKVAVGDELLRRWAGKEVDFGHPEVRFDVQADLTVRVKPAPMFIAGRYRKLSRGIPATKWIHHRCRGQGCDACGFTGTLCGPSIQEMLEGPVLAATGGLSTLFHGLGREDTDVRMLGRGRPFVLEVHAPLRRRIDPQAIAAAVALRAEELAWIGGLRLADREMARAVKTVRAEKTYRALVIPEGTPPADAAARANAIAGALVAQTSPTRVAARRGRDIVRSRRVLESRWLGSFEGGWLWEVRAEAGTYIKELVSGDEGRTRPSLAEALGIPCHCAALDVLEIHWDPPWEEAAPDSP